MSNLIENIDKLPALLIIATICIVIVLAVFRIFRFKFKFGDKEFSTSDKPSQLTYYDRKTIVNTIYACLTYFNKNIELKENIIEIQMEYATQKMVELEFILIKMFFEKIGADGITKFAIDNFIDKSTYWVKDKIRIRVKKNHLADLLPEADDTKEISDLKLSDLHHKSNGLFMHLVTYYKDYWSHLFPGINNDESANLIIENKEPIITMFNHMFLELGRKSKEFRDDITTAKNSFDNSLKSTMDIDDSILTELHNKFD